MAKMGQPMLPSGAVPAQAESDAESEQHAQVRDYELRYYLIDRK